MRAALLRQSCTTTRHLCNDNCRKTTGDTDALVLRGSVPAL